MVLRLNSCIMHCFYDNRRSGLWFVYCFYIGWALAYMIVNGIAGVRLVKLNFTNHPMSSLITNEQLYERLSTFAHPDFIVEKGVGVFVFYLEIRQCIQSGLIKKQTYSIISKLRKKSMLTNRHYPGIKEYIHAYKAIPIVQNAVNSAIPFFKNKKMLLLKKHH